MGNHINDYWEAQAVFHKKDHSASWSDKFAIELEIENIGEYIDADADVLDVGCANGYSAISQYLRHGCKSMTGIDYSESMIRYANEAKEEHNLPDHIRFEVGDVRSIRFAPETFDVVYTTRVLINLSTWDEQIQGISECLRLARKGGRVVLSEAFWEPLVLLNSIRTVSKLPPLVEHDYNRYLKKANLENYLKEQNIEFQCKDFSSLYYLGSRFIRELIPEHKGFVPYDNPINKMFFDLQNNYSGGEYGIQQIYVLTKG